MKITKTKVADHLYIYSRDSGSEYYVFRGTVAGKRIERSLGSVKSMGLKDAKREAAACLVNAEEDKAEAERPALAAILPQALEDISTVRQLRHARQIEDWRKSLERYAIPLIGDRRVAEIDRQDILKVLTPIWTKTPSIASVVRMRLEAVLNWATTHGFRDGINPALWRGNLELFLPRIGRVHEVQHREAPTIEELRSAVKKCLAHPSVYSGGLLFVLATVCRVSEACIAKSAEVSDGVWSIPKEHTKVGAGLRVPLSSLAKAALAMAPEGEYLFTTPVGHLCRSTILNALKRLCPRGKDDPVVTIHGIRSTFRDWCAETGVPDAEAEKSLGHQWGSAVTRAYYRSDLLDQRKALMQRWADELMK